MKAIAVIFFAIYIAFCATLYFAGNEKQFRDPFVSVAGNATPSVAGNTTPSPAEPARPEPTSQSPGGTAGRKAPVNDSATSPAKTTPAKPK